MPDSAGLSITGSLSIDAWLFLRSYSSEFAPIVSKWNDIGVNDRGYFLAVNAAHQLEAQLSTDSLWNPGVGSHAIVLMSAGTVPLNAWTHVAFVFDSTSRVLTLYVNGIAAASATSQFATIFDNVEPLFIGAGDLGANQRDFTNGLIDEVEVFHRALAPGEVQALVDAGPAGKCTGSTFGDDRPRVNVGGGAAAIVGAAGEAAKENRARAAAAAASSAACAPITATNAQSLTQVGQVMVAIDQQLRWAGSGTAFYAIGRNEVDRFDAVTLQKTVLYAGASRVLDFSPDSGLVALSTGATTVLMRDLNAQQDKGTITAGAQYTSAALSPNGQLIAISLVTEIAEEVRNTANGALTQKYSGFMTGSPVYSATFSPDGQSLVWLARARVQLQSLATAAFGPAFEHEDFVLGTSIAAGRLATAFGEGLRLWDLTSGAVIEEFRPSPGAFSVALNHDAGLLFGGNKTDVLVYNTATKALVADVVKPSAQIALSPNECTLLAASADGTVAVLVVAQGGGSGGAIQPPNTGDGGLLAE